MNCGNCGKPLEPGNGTCPHCGALNLGFQEPVNTKMGDQAAVDLGLPDDVEELNDDAPAEVVEETIEEQQPEESIYGEDVDKIEEEKENVPEGLNIDIPTVAAPTEPVGNVTGIDEVNENRNTIGDINVSETENDGIEPRSKLTKAILTLKRTKKIPTKLCIIIVIIFLTIGIITGKLVFSKNVCTVPVSSSLGKTSNNIKSNGKKSETRIGSFIYKIPDDSLYDRRENGLYIYAKDDSWRVYIQEKAGSYSDIANSQKSIKETVKLQGYDVASVVEKNIEDKLFVIINTTKTTQNRLSAYTDAGNDKLFYVEIITSTNDFSEEVLAKVSNILKDCEEVETSETKMEKIPVSDFSEVVIKSSQEYSQVKQAEAEAIKQAKAKESTTQKAQ